MTFGVLGLDYDGTIAIDGALDPEVRAAIAEVRSAGVVVVLVTGRILDDSRRVAGDLRFVDAVVAERFHRWPTDELPDTLSVHLPSR